MPRTRMIALLALALAVAGSAHAQASDSALIARAQQVPVRTLDSTLTATPFMQWLTSLRPTPAPRVRWELNDCGEGGDGREAPFCAEAVVALGSDTTAHAAILVASPSRNASGAPAIWTLYAQVGDTTVNFRTLPEWAAFVRPRSP